VRRRPPPPAKGLAGAIDRFAAVISPKWHRSRVQQRTAASLIGALSPYRGSEHSELRSDWITSDGSADHDTLYDMETLRERARHQVRNDGVAVGMLSTIVRNTVGTGIRPQSRVDGTVLGLDKKQVREFQRAAEGIFRRWMPFADARHEISFPALQRLIVRSFEENGDVFVVIRDLPLECPDGRRRPFSTAIELVEADRVSTPGSFPRHINPNTGNEVRGGVERNADGQAVACWILKKHPGDYALAGFVRRAESEYMRVAKYDEHGIRRVIHLIDPLRIGQSRGITGFAPVLSDLKDIQDSLEAERIGQRLAACVGLVHKTGNPFGVTEDEVSGTDDEGHGLEDFAPAMIHRIGLQDSIDTINPQRPGAGFDPFVMRNLRIIGAARGVPYEATSMDYSQVNFASGKCARNDARVTFLINQQQVELAWQDMYEAVMLEAFDRRMLPEFTRFNYLKNRDLYTRAEWIGPGYGYVQPDKEIGAARDGIQLGVTHPGAAAAENGFDVYEAIDQTALVEEYRREKGLPSIFALGGVAQPAKEEADPDEEHLPEPKKKPVGARA